MEEYRAGGVFDSSGALTQWNSGRARLANFPSPFLDYASTQIPKDVESLWKWCAYFAICNPLINAAIARKASYPVTNLVVQHTSDDVASSWENLLDRGMNVNDMRLLFNMDLFVYGRAAVSVFPPFRKYMVCKGCGKIYLAEAIKFRINPRSRSFEIACPKCDDWMAALARDLVLASPYGFTLRRWSPQELIYQRRGFLNEEFYFVKPATWFRNNVKRGNRADILSTPQTVLDAILRDEAVQIRRDRIFVKVEEGAIMPVNTHRSAWPFGSLAAVLKDAYHLQIAYKNEEVNLVTQMIPFRAVSPAQTGNAAADVFATGAYPEWETRVKEEYAKFMQDPGYLAILPVPMQNVQTQTTPSPMLPKDPVYQRLSNVLAGIRVPQSIVVEGAPWSGAVPNLKLFEQDCKKNQKVQTDLLEFVVAEVRRVLKWPVPEISLGTMMSVDAIQRISAYSGLVSSGTLDRKTLHEEVLGVDHETVEKRIDEESDRARARRIEDMRAEATEQMRQQREAAAQMPQQGAPVDPNAPSVDPNAPQLDANGNPIDPNAMPMEGDPNAMAQEQMAQPMQPAQSGMPTMANVVAQFPQREQPGMTRDRMGGSHFTVDQILDTVQPGAGPETAGRVIQLMKYQTPRDTARLLQGIARKAPTLHQLIISQMHGGGVGDGSGGTDMRPLPEQLPARREGGGY